MAGRSQTAYPIDRVTHGTTARAVERTGGVVMRQMQAAGRACLLFVDTCGQLGRVRTVMPQLMRQIELGGFGSLMVLALIAGLTGMIMAVQTGSELKNFGVVDKLGAIIGATFCREMGPIWTAVITLSRVGAAMAAELGTMAVNEEVDALRVMSINPVRFLVLPRVLALVIAMPMLTAVADLVGMFGGAFISATMFDVSYTTFWDSAKSLLGGLDFWSGLFKSCVFACIIGTIACDRGMNTQDGAEGVGRSTTATVVLSVVFVLLADFVLTTFVQLVLRPVFNP